MMMPAATAGLTPSEARSGLTTVLSDTEQLVAADWERRDDPTPRSCAVQWGLEGVTYSALRSAEPPTSTSRLADRVQSAWEGWGYSVVRTEVGPATQLVATSSPTSELLVFRVSERGMTLQGESACRPSP